MVVEGTEDEMASLLGAVDVCALSNSLPWKKNPSDSSAGLVDSDSKY